MKPYLSLLLLVLILPQVWGFETTLAEFSVSQTVDATNSVDGKDFHAKLLADLVALDVKGSVGFHFQAQSSTRGVVSSALDAAQACEIGGWETLIYGQVTAAPTSIEVEVHIYSHPDRKVLKTILLRSTWEDYDRLVQDAAQKIYSFFDQALGLSKTDSRYIADQNSWLTQDGAYWWGTVSPWRESMTSIAGIFGSYSFRLGDPLWANGEWAWLQEFGLYASLALAVNPPGTIPYRLFDFQLGPSATETFAWQRRHEFFVTVIPAARVHILSYQPLYLGQQQAVVVWYGLGADVGYRFWIDPGRTLGLAIQAGTSVFGATPAFIDYRVGAALVWRGVFP